MDVETAEQQLEAWVKERRGWKYKVENGYHVVRDPLGELMARNQDPAVAMEILERR